MISTKTFINEALVIQVDDGKIYCIQGLTAQAYAEQTSGDIQALIDDIAIIDRPLEDGEYIMICDMVYEIIEYPDGGSESNLLCENARISARTA